MGNSQGRPSSAPPVHTKSPRSGKYPETHPKNVANTNGLEQHNSNHSHRKIRHSKVEFDIPEFLQDKQGPTEARRSPIVQRNLRDPDLIIVEEGSSPNRGLLIPKSELQVPDFLSTRNRQNGKVASDVSKQSAPYANGASKTRGSRQQIITKTPASRGLHSSIDEINMEFYSQRHRKTAEQLNEPTPYTSRETVDMDSTPAVSKPLHSRSMNNLQAAGSSNLLRELPQGISPEFVDDFGAFSLKRKYRTSGGKERGKLYSSPEERLAPGVTTGKYAVMPVSQPVSSRNVRSGEDVNRNLQGLQNGGVHWSTTDTDSLQSVSSLSYTDPTSLSSSLHVARKPKNTNQLQQDRTISLNPPQGYESPDSALGYIADSSLNYPDSSIDERSRKISRQNSFQAHLRQRVQDYERLKPTNQNAIIHMRHDSDSTTISDQSIFGEGMSSVTRAAPHQLLHINSFQDDILLKIFSYLNTLDLCKTSGVCRRWQNLAWDPILWNSIDILHYKESDINRILRHLLATLAEGTQGYCLTIHIIKLNGCELVSDKALRSIARYCIDLEELEISGCCCVTSRGLQDLLLNCHNLHHLNISGCTCVNSLSLPNSNGFSLENHGSFLKLRHLDMSDCVAFDDFGLRTLGLTCGLLESLYLRRCSRITDVGIKHIASHCRHLKELSTSDCLKVRDFSLKEIGKNAPGLKYLSAAKCPVSDTGIKYIGRHCVRLKYLNVRGCEAITDIGIAYVVQNCLKLRSMDIGKCDITDSVLHTIGIHCPQLKKLSIKGCIKLSDEGIRIIATQCCNLQYFNVQECNLSYETFSYIREHCRNCIIEHTCPAFF